MNEPIFTVESSAASLSRRHFLKHSSLALAGAAAADGFFGSTPGALDS